MNHIGTASTQKSLHRVFSLLASVEGTKVSFEITLQSTPPPRRPSLGDSAIHTRGWFRQFLVIHRCLDKGGGGGMFQSHSGTGGVGLW